MKKEIIFLLIISTFLSLGSEEKFKEEDIKKFKYLKKYRVNKDDKVAKFLHNNGREAGVILEGDIFKISGEFLDHYDEKTNTNYLEKLTKHHKLIQKDDGIELKYIKTEKQSPEDVEEINLYETALLDIYFPPVLEKYPEVINKYIPKNVHVNFVLEEDINNDLVKDIIVIFSFPSGIGKFSSSRKKVIKEDIMIAIILSDKRSYQLQFIDYLTLSRLSAIVDVKVVNPLKIKRKQIFVRMVTLVNSWQGESVLFVLE